MKQRLSGASLLLIVAALLALTNCTDATLVPIPGRLTIQVQFLPTTPGAFDLIQIAWSGSMPNPPNDPPDAGETTLQNEPAKTINRGAQNAQETITRNNLHVGVWQFSLTATGTRTGQNPVNLVTSTCTQEIFANRATTMTFTEQGSTCTCTAGCTAP